jgi:hypothetical protein
VTLSTPQHAAQSTETPTVATTVLRTFQYYSVLQYSTVVVPTQCSDNTNTADCSDLWPRGSRQRGPGVFVLTLGELRRSCQGSRICPRIAAAAATWRADKLWQLAKVLAFRFESPTTRTCSTATPQRERENKSHSHGDGKGDADDVVSQTGKLGRCYSSALDSPEAASHTDLKRCPPVQGRYW